MNAIRRDNRRATLEHYSDAPTHHTPHRRITMNVKHPATITGHVVAVKRHGHTVYGNPTMSAVIHLTAIDGVEAVTSTPVTVRISDNASIVYGIENAEYREQPHTFALTRAGRISHEVR